MIKWRAAGRHILCRPAAQVRTQDSTMKLSNRSIAVVAAFLMAGRPASCQQQARPAPFGELLKKPLSVTMPPCSLSTALKELSALSGVELRASPDVAGLRVFLFVRDLALATVQDRLAEVLHLTWERT